MYLHQGLVDVLLLQISNIKRLRLYSYYTYSIKSNDCISNLQYNFKQRPNNLTKLRYQWKYKNKGIKIFIKQIKRICYNPRSNIHTKHISKNLEQNYFCIRFKNNIIMDIASSVGHTNLFKKCLQLGLLPTQETLDYASTSNIEIYKICLKYELCPQIDHIYDAIYRDNVELFKICLDYGLKTKLSMLQCAYNNEIKELIKTSIT